MGKITRRVESGVIPLPGARTDVAGRFSVAEVRLGDLLEARRPELNIPIKPRDVIAVPRADMVYVIGGVNRAGRFALNDRESVTVLQALALAGGLKRTAKKKAARICVRARGPSGLRSPSTWGASWRGGRRMFRSSAKTSCLCRTAAGKVAARRIAEAALAMGTGVMVWRVGRGN